MATMSFNDNAPASTSDETASNLPAVRESAEVQSYQAPGLGEFVGDYDQSDVRIPKLNVVQAIGDLSADFQPGTILFDKQWPLACPAKDSKEWGESVYLTVLSARKFFQEILPFGGDRMPDIAQTAEEVIARGGTLDYVGDTKPTWRPVLSVMALVESANLAFGDLLPGRENPSTPCLYTLSGVAYTSVAKTWNAFRSLNKTRKIYEAIWQFQTRREKRGENWVFVPRALQKGWHTPEAVAQIEGMMKQG